MALLCPFLWLSSWRRLFRVPWTARRYNQSILKEISLEYSLEGLMLKLKLQYFGHLKQITDSCFWKDRDAGKDWRQEEKGMAEDKMVGWHHWLNGHEFGWAPGDGEGQGSLSCNSPPGHKESYTTEQMNNILSCATSSCVHCCLERIHREALTCLMKVYYC